MSEHRDHSDPAGPPQRRALRWYQFRLRTLLFGPEMLADPYPVYDKLRAAHPVFRVPALDAWVVTSYEGVNGALRKRGSTES